MHVQNATLKALVQGEKQFRVPIWQRQYTWGVSQGTVQTRLRASVGYGRSSRRLGAGDLQSTTASSPPSFARSQRRYAMSPQCRRRDQPRGSQLDRLAAKAQSAPDLSCRRRIAAPGLPSRRQVGLFTCPVLVGQGTRFLSTAHATVDSDAASRLGGLVAELRGVHESQPVRRLRNPERLGDEPT
jgi:hypothetical protein